MNLLQMSFAGAVMILAVIVIRALCIHKLPKISFLILWEMVLLRLLIPITVPSAFSIYSLLQRPALQSTFLQGKEALPKIMSGIAGVFKEQTGQTEKTEVSEAAAIPKITETTDKTLHEKEASLLPAAAGTNPNPLPLRKLFWLAGLAVCGGYFTTAYLKCRKEFQMSLPIDNEIIKQWRADRAPASSGMGTFRKPMEIRQSDCISTPISYGILRPVILLPKTEEWNDAETINYILEHEYVHIQRFDTVTKLLMTAAVCVHWFNPLVWCMYVLLNRDLEISCDETVLLRMEKAERAERKTLAPIAPAPADEDTDYKKEKALYARILIHMEETKNKLTPFYNGFSKNALEERIVAIMKMKKTPKLVWMLAIVLIAGVAVVFGTSSGTVFARAQNTFQEGSASAANDEITAVGEEDGAIAIAEEEYDYRKALKKYEEFGIADENGLLYYKGERVRYFLDGYELPDTFDDEEIEGVISRYQYYDSKGTVDVHTVRNDVQNADGSTELFGEIVDIAAYPQEEFKKRNYAYWWNDNGNAAETGDSVYWLTEYAAASEDSTAVILSEDTVSTAWEAGTASSAETDSVLPIGGAENASEATMAVPAEMNYTYIVEQTEEGDTQQAEEEATVAAMRENVDGWRGWTLKERVDGYKEFGLTYQKTYDGKEILYLDGLKVKSFIEKKPSGSIFSYTIDEGEVNARVIYDDNGKVVGIEKEYLND